MIAKTNWDIFSKLKETLTISHEEIYYQNLGSKTTYTKTHTKHKKDFHWQIFV